MAITKTEVVDKIEVLEDGIIQIRTATVIKEDNTELSRTFMRHFITPCSKLTGSWVDTDISGEDARVQAIANATWTDSVKTAYQTKVDSQSTP